MKKCVSKIPIRNIVVAVSEYGEFFAMLTLCRLIEPVLVLHPVFVFSSNYALAKEHGQLVELHNWSWTKLCGSRRGQRLESYYGESDVRSKSGYLRVFDPVSLSNGKHTDKWARSTLLRNFLIARIYAGYVRTRIQLIFRRPRIESSPTRRPMGALKRLRLELAHAEDIIDAVKPKLILSGQDYALSVTSILSKIGEVKGIQTAIVPYCMPPTTREIIETFAYFGHNRLVGIEEKLAKFLNPKWLNTRREQTFCRVNVLDGLASDYLGLTPPEPWLPNSGRGIVFAPSQQGYDYYVRSGIPHEKLRLTGASWNDHFVRSASTVSKRKAKLLDRLISAQIEFKSRRNHGALSLERNVKEIIIVSWPPNQWPRKAVGCASYKDLCEQFISCMNNIQSSGIANVAISLHPTITDAELIEGLQSSGLYILRSSLMDYVDCADIFVSTVSSTSFWALQCGIPTINFDGYLYGYTEFDEAGAITVRTAQEVYDASDKLIGDEANFLETKRRIAESAPYFSVTDGQSSVRIVNELAALVALDSQ